MKPPHAPRLVSHAGDAADNVCSAVDLLNRPIAGVDGVGWPNAGHRHLLTGRTFRLAGICHDCYREIEIYRYDPDADAHPWSQHFTIVPGPGDRMLLDVLERLKGIDNSLSYRRSCREGICGSDAMNINGRNGLACVANLDELPSELCFARCGGCQSSATSSST